MAAIAHFELMTSDESSMALLAEPHSMLDLDLDAVMDFGGIDADSDPLLDKCSRVTGPTWTLDHI
jgi:hypothetical protein